MEVRFWGVRGSHPASGPAFSAFGHHTLCVSVLAGEDLILLDAGSGAAHLAAHLDALPHRRRHLLLSHFHHDHLMGLPALLHAAAATGGIAIHVALGADLPLRQVLGTLFGAPYFPVPPERMFQAATFTAHAPGAGFDLGAVRVRSVLVDHPGGAAAYRLDSAGRSLVFATDLEASDAPKPSLRALAEGCDLLLHDTMFTPEEAQAHRGWGHSTGESAMALARAAGAARLVGLHHHPLAEDEALIRREARLAGIWPGFHLAREGDLLRL